MPISFPDSAPCVRRRLMRAALSAAVAAGAILLVGVLSFGSTGCSDCDLEITSTTLPEGTVGVQYTSSLRSNCGGDAWFVSSGQLPPGVGLLEDGFLRGVPTMPGIFNFTLGLIDFDSEEQTFKGLSITIKPAT